MTLAPGTRARAAALPHPSPRRLGRLPASGLAGLAAMMLLAGCSGAGGSAAASGSSGQDARSQVPEALRLVAVGDSIPYNSPQDCPGCRGFVDRYADAVEAATGRPVTVTNLSEHTGLTLPGLLDSFDGVSGKLAAADVIVVGIAHNSTELASDEPCGTPLDANDRLDWTALTPECADRSAEEYRPQFESLFSQIAALRAGQPTVLRAINRYNDWIGWVDGKLEPEQEQKTAMIIAAWNEMLCEAAEENGFSCADVSATFNGSDGRTPSGDLLAADHTHPSDLGNAAIAEVLAELGFDPLA